MTMANKDMLLSLYEQTLLSLGCIITADGMVSLEATGEPVNLASGERLVVPTDERLSKLAGSKTAAFHPMSENVILGQSNVIRLTRTLVNQAITHKVLTTMVGIATGISNGVEMKAAQLTKLSSVSGIDAKTVKYLVKLTNAIDHQTPQRLVNVFLKHGGSIGATSYKRTAFVSWPLYDELVSVTEDSGDTVYGITMRKKDVVYIRSLLELVLEHINVPEYYSFGSNSKAAPYFHALLSAYGNVLTDLNKITWPFRKVILDALGESPHVTIDFITDFGEGDAYRHIIPSLDHNQGNSVDGQAQSAAAISEQPIMQQPQEQVQQVPMQQAQPQMQPVAQQQPVYQPQGTMIQQPVYQPQPVQPPPQQQSRWNLPTIGAQTGPATGISSNGQAVTQTAQPNVLQTQQDIMNVAYPPTMYPHLYAHQQMPMLQAQYPQFGGVQQQPAYQQQPTYQQQGTMIPQPAYQQQGMMQPIQNGMMMQPMQNGMMMQQPMYQQNGMMMQQPMQPQNTSAYPSFSRAK